MKVAVLLSGCGIGDGSQIEEVILTYLALDKYQVDYICIAPDKNQMHTFNHFTETVEESETRNILVESSRIGRGKISPLSSIKYDEIDALILPGGQGVFKNLSDYIVAHELFKVDEEVEQIIKTFHSSQKPIGAICGALLLVGKSLNNEKSNIKLSTSNDSFVKALRHTNTTLVNVKSSESYLDLDNKIVSTPAFLGTQNLFEMMLGIDDLVKKLIELHENK